VAFLALLALSLFPVVTTATDPVAVIASVKGRVDVTSAHGGPVQRATFGRALQPGDRLSVAAGGAATLFFNDGNVVELAEKSTMTVSGRVGGKSQAGPAAGLPGEVYASVSKFVAGGSRETGLIAGSPLRGAPDAGAPMLIAPRNTAVIDARPAFRWRGVEGASRYRLAVSSAERGELWTREVTGLSAEWPAEVAAIESGDYLWEVEALSDARSLRKEGSAFRVLAASDAASIRGNLDRIRESAGGADSPAARYLAGSYLSGLGLYQDATEQFGALCRLSPASPAPHEALGTVYRKVGLMDLAAAEFQQALALTREP
jgi:hypothetical protein